MGCADLPKPCSALSVRGKIRSCSPARSTRGQTHYEWPAPYLVLVQMSQTGRHLEPRSTVRSQTTSSNHYTPANVLIKLCACRSGGPQDAPANDLGEHGDSMV